MKIGVSELAPLTFRALTLPFAGAALLGIALAQRQPIRVPRTLWRPLAWLALFNITGWNGFVLFGVQHLPAGRSAILGYTMPLWATLCAVVVVGERLTARRAIGLALGMAGMLLLIGDELHTLRGAGFGVTMILIAAFSWGLGTALLRRWPLPMSPVALTGWMIVLGWIPIALLVPVFDPTPLPAELARLTWRGWFALAYNVLPGGLLANWAWFSLARTLPVSLSSLLSLPIPVAGVFAGMIILGERPGPSEWAALALVVLALFIVMFRRDGAAQPTR
ncbi:MAG: EamA family transporter [Proteobacteria bacterium]|jgi:drug/metabolite transporter (DMT)-like permease|nr:EamA family transporter [Pseudomonadota bacterium]